MELTKEEIEAFDGLNESYVQMDKELTKIAPRCHFTPMNYEEADYDAWWECSHCGHSKVVGMLGRPY